MRRLPAFLIPLLAVVLAPIAKSEAQQLTERAVETAPAENKTAWTLSSGFVLNTGNTESWTLSGGTNLQLIRGRHSFLAETAFNTSAANVEDDMGVETGYATNARNLNSRLRYDYFFTTYDAAYASIRHRWDTFAGLDTRLQNQIGYLRNFFKEEKHRFWGEVGYDLTYDNFDPDPLPDPDMPGEFLPGSAIVHAGRLYLGYMNNLNEHVLFETGGEVLFNFQVGRDIRFNYDARLLSTVAAKLQIELKFRLQYDNEPVPGNDALDTTTIANLIVTLL
jgi:putative salt-induced outer membrane protein YdiY